MYQTCDGSQKGRHCLQPALTPSRRASCSPRLVLRYSRSRDAGRFLTVRYARTTRPPTGYRCLASCQPQARVSDARIKQTSGVLSVFQVIASANFHSGSERLPARAIFDRAPGQEPRRARVPSALSIEPSTSWKQGNTHRNCCRLAYLSNSERRRR